MKFNSTECSTGSDFKDSFDDAGAGLDLNACEDWGEGLGISRDIGGTVNGISFIRYPMKEVHSPVDCKIFLEEGFEQGGYIDRGCMFGNSEFH